MEEGCELSESENYEQSYPRSEERRMDLILETNTKPGGEGIEPNNGVGSLSPTARSLLRAGNIEHRKGAIRERATCNLLIAKAGSQTESNFAID